MNAAQPTPSLLSRIVIPLIVIVLGTAWLLTSLEILPQVNWVFVLLLAAAGGLLLLLRPLSRARLVAGLIMPTVALGELLHDLSWLARDIEVPVLVILGGGYAFIAQFLALEGEKAAVTPPGPEAPDHSSPT
jgi:hypothetical protein